MMTNETWNQMSIEEKELWRKEQRAELEIKQLELTELMEQEEQNLVLKTEPVQENLLRFYAKQEEVLKIAQGRFYYKGELVEDKYQVYERFNEWLKMAEEEKQVSNPVEEKWENFTEEFNKTRIDNINW
jgi:hypothetical protein